MTYLFAHWTGLAKRLSAAKRRLYLFDIDGTLAPIARTPDKARVSSSTRNRLRALAERPGTRVGILSGRSLSNAREMLQVPGLIYSGNHGLEIQGPGLKFIHPQANRLTPSLVTLRPYVSTLVEGIPGVLIESKKLTSSVHYRAVPARYRRRFHQIEGKLASLVHKHGFVTHPGKKVVEIRPRVRWGKGAALGYIRARLASKPMVLFVGDDETDEAVFKALRPSDIGVRVGRRKGSDANYYLKSQREIEGLLKKLVKLK